MTTANPVMESMVSEVNTEVREHRGWFLALGILTIIAGTAAIIFPFIASLTTTLLIGWIFSISGAIGIVHAFRTAKWRGFLLSLLGALLTLGVGIVLLLYPITGVLSLTLLLAAFFLANGVVRIILAFQLRPHDHWIWLLLSGFLGLAVAAMILVQWPSTALWVIGLLVGIDLIFAGWTSIILAMRARRSPMRDTSNAQ